MTATWMIDDAERSLRVTRIGSLKSKNNIIDFPFTHIDALLLPPLLLQSCLDLVESTLLGAL